MLLFMVIPAMYTSFDNFLLPLLVGGFDKVSTRLCDITFLLYCLLSRFYLYIIAYPENFYRIISVLLVLFNNIYGHFYLNYSIDLSSINFKILWENGIYSLNILPGSNAAAGSSYNTGGGSNPPGGGLGPNHGFYSDSSTKQILDTRDFNQPSYDPSEGLPPRSYMELHDLMKYRIQQRIDRGYPVHTVLNIFSHENNITNDTAKGMLFKHIFENKLELEVAHRELCVNLKKPVWGSVRINLNSPIMKSLLRNPTMIL